MTSVFKRMGRDKTPMLSMFQRLRGGKSPKPFVFTRIKMGGKFLSSSPAQDRNSVLSRLGKLNEVQSSVPSSRKRVSTLGVKTDGSLKVKICTLVITNYGTSSNSRGKIKDEEKPSPHPFIVWETGDLKAESRSNEALEIPENVEDLQHGLASGKFLKHHFP